MEKLRRGHVSNNHLAHAGRTMKKATSDVAFFV
jgi:hypothetical protein